MSDNERLIDQIQRYRNDPTSIQRVILDKLNQAYDGQLDIPDPTNPFIFLLESASVASAAAMQQQLVSTRQIYPTVAVTQEDLYRHMADEDYIGRFALPGQANFKFMFSLAEIVASAVEDLEGGVRKAVLPRNTAVNVAGNIFGLHYPIEIRVLPNEAIQVVYDGREVNPLQTLVSNVLPYEITTIEGVEFILIDVTLFQFDLNVSYFPSNISTGLRQAFSFSAQFYFARVFTGSDANGWREMHTTHSDQIFNPQTPTALLRVVEQELQVRIPDIYSTQGQLGSQIRVDIYTTDGESDAVLSNFPPSQFQVQWRDIAVSNNNIFTAPLDSLSNYALFSDDTVQGGRNGISVDALRERVVFNGNRKPVPVTPTDLATTLSDRGYRVVKQLDDITDRSFIATRLLPAPIVEAISSPVGVITATTAVNLTRIIDLPTVADNGNRITLLPGTLFTYENGRLETLLPAEQTTLANLPAERQIAALNQRTYVYTPFHYVMDTNDSVFDLRAYYLDAPTITARRFYRDNVNLAAQASTQLLSIERVEQGFRLLITANIENLGDTIELNQLVLQLGFQPDGDERFTMLNGSFNGFVAQQPVYEFIIETNFDITADDGLAITNFRQYRDDIQVYYTRLTTEFRLFYIIMDANIPPRFRSDIDRSINRDILQGDPVGLLEEGLVIELGNALPNLRSESRTVIASQPYQVYQQDVLWTYDTDVFEKDENGLNRFEVVDGKPVFQYLHRKGDPILSDEGEPQILFEAGEVVRDEEGNPIPVGEQGVNRHITLVCFDARFFFATDPAIVAYRATIPQTIINFLEDDIDSLSGLLIERTRVNFAPRQTIGNISITIRDDEVRQIPSAQSFIVEYYMRQQGFDDIELRTAIIRSTRDVIAQALVQETVSVTDIERRLADVAGGEVVSVNIDGLGPDNNLLTYTVVDQTAVSSVATRLELQTEGTITVADDITVNFIKHQ